MGNGEALVAGRDCSNCTLCCKVMGVQELAKPAGTWCTHCAPRSGCTIYETRPGGCREFFCGWRRDPAVPEWFRPNVAKIVLVVEQDGRRMVAQVDPGTPQAWRVEPYYGQLKAWARDAVTSNRQVLARIGKRVIAILPDREVDVGVVGEDETVVTAARMTAGGIAYTAYRAKVADVLAAEQRGPL